jgi:hypothetical protein
MGQTERFDVTMQLSLAGKEWIEEAAATIGWGVLGISAMLGSVPVVAQAEDNDGSKLMMTAPVNGAAVAGRAGIPSLLPYGTVLSRKNRNSK